MFTACAAKQQYLMYISVMMVQLLRNKTLANVFGIYEDKENHRIVEILHVDQTTSVTMWT